ncbi:uncharacterized protein J3D65DRAFT_222768 [Phyllosticta citribraziliensis]|uniref:Uncharacterized protein n=1 Tax=Phyllosticta citribraziliensis TaxID=989973 RepID=A0ABR1M4V5_9PEZI
MSGSNNNSRRNSSHSYQGDPPPYGWERDPPPGYYSRGAYFDRPPPYRGQYPAISEPPGSRRQQSFQNWPFPPPRSTVVNRRQQAYQDWPFPPPRSTAVNGSSHFSATAHPRSSSISYYPSSGTAGPGVSTGRSAGLYTTSGGPSRHPQNLFGYESYGGGPQRHGSSYYSNGFDPYGYNPSRYNSGSFSSIYDRLESPRSTNTRASPSSRRPNPLRMHPPTPPPGTRY